MWSNIGKVSEHKESLEFLPSPRRSIDSGTGKPLNDAMYVYADCHSSIRGTFLGKYLIFLLYFHNHIGTYGVSHMDWVDSKKF